MHFEAFEYVGTHLPEGVESVLDLGSFNVNGSARSLFRGGRVEYVGVDIRPGADVDLVMDAGDPALPDLVGRERFDLVLCLETLEHTPNGPDIIRNAAACLRPCGVLLVTTAGPARAPHGVMGGPVTDEYYANLTPEELARWLADAGFASYDVQRARDSQDVVCRGQLPCPAKVATW